MASAADAMRQVYEREAILGRDAASVFPTETVTNAKAEGLANAVQEGMGAVKFVTDSIEAGNQTSGSVWLNGTGPQSPGSASPYGLWGALGTRANSEVIDEEL